MAALIGTPARQGREAEPAGPRADPQRVSLDTLIRLKVPGESLMLGSRRVQAQISGGHLSAFKGRGVEFDESRPYQPGDDLRTMDWRVTARTGKAHTKVFREERNRPVMVWLDLRANMLFGTRSVFKAVRAAEAAALVAWSAVGNGDRLGGLVFADDRQDELRPRLGRRAALQLFQVITHDDFWLPDVAATSMHTPDRALLQLARVTRPGSLTFLFSDFLGLGADGERSVRQLASHGEVVILRVYDPIEAELPPPGQYRIQSGGRSFSIDTTDPRLRAAHRARFDATRTQLETLARLRGVHLLECATTDDPCAILTRQFRRR